MCVVHGNYNHMYVCCPWKILLYICINVVHGKTSFPQCIPRPMSIPKDCILSKSFLDAAPQKPGLFQIFYKKKNLPHFHLRTLLQTPSRMPDITKKFHPPLLTLAPLISHPARGSQRHPSLHNFLNFGLYTKQLHFQHRHPHLNHTHNQGIIPRKITWW